MSPHSELIETSKPCKGQPQIELIAIVWRGLWSGTFIHISEMLEGDQMSYGIDRMGCGSPHLN